MRYSVLMSVYAGTHATELDRCLNSIATQSLKPDQIVLIRDGPINEHVETCIADYALKLPIDHLCFPQNRGLGCALRDGLEICKNEFVARVDSDDWSVPGRFQTQTNYLVRNASISVIGGWLREYYESKSGELGVVRKTPINPLSVESTARRRNPINHPTVMFRKSHVYASGSYKPCLFFEDYFLWARMLAAGYLLANIPEVLVETRVESEYFSRRGGLSYVRHELNLIKKLIHLNFLSTTDAAIFMLSRLPIRLLPNSLRHLAYKHFLRSL